MEQKKRVIALGFFDGVHNGHAALMRRTAQVAREIGATPAAFTFDPHPQTVILGRPMPLLTSPEDRADLMRKYYGIQDVIVEPFTPQRMKQPWREFLEETLVGDLGAVHLVAGHDYHFGYKGEGNPQRLQQTCQALGIGCDIIPKVEQEGITVSSTYIRTLVAQGEIERANEFLGHPYTLSDRVSHGKKLGSTLGFPTVNLRLKENVLSPAKGVYATKVILENGETHPAVTNVGTRPTVDDGNQLTIEGFILDFQGENRIYIATMYPFDEESHRRIARHRAMRAEKKFTTMERYIDLEHLTIPAGADVLLECMSNLVANEIYQEGGAGENTVAAVLSGIRHLLEQAGNLVVVTNEVFSDGITYDPETEKYLEKLGAINGQMAQLADAVTEVVYGIPISHKKTGEERKNEEVLS